MSDTNAPGNESVPEDVLLRLLSELPEIIRRTESQIRELSTYDALPPPELADAIDRNVIDVVETLRAAAVPTPEYLADLAERVVHRRVEQGVPVEDMMRTYRVSLAVINDQFIELAMNASIDAREVLRGSQLIWALSDAFMTNVAQEYQRFTVESALLDDQAKADLVQGLLFGTGNPAEMARACEQRGLDPAASYHAVRAHASDTTVLSAVLQSLQRSGNEKAIVSPFRGEALGLTADVPNPVAGAIIAVGTALPLNEVAASFATASRVLDAALRLDRGGVVGVADLSWRVAAVNDAEVTQLLHQRYIEPFRDRGEFGEQLLDSVRHYLESDRNIAAAADSMYVHKNTLRYRLRKFEELVSASLESTNVLVELSWILACEPAPNRSPTRP
ncbi:hypothetical protein CH267_00475 [Rhodococcus sp. 06-621-2]|nr:helix-turn-helix domain-containing protein [Rhodococcus sp. 06-621-2]OZC62859.1 hypothetical protein CH267_00475 [Rhodococcus sp. 06-621-2]